MALEWLRLNDFRGFERLDLRFEPDLTVLVGVNGCGKTSVIDALLVGLELMPWKYSDVKLGARQAEILIGLEGIPPIHRVVRTGKTRGLARKRPRGPSLRELVFTYSVDRPVRDATPGSTQPGEWNQDDARHDPRGPEGYDRFFHWFREMEDEENERFRYGESTESPSLDAVRSAVRALLPGYDHLRVIRRGAMGLAIPRLTVEKNGDVLLFDSLSEGERTIIAMIADIARRLVIAHPESPRPLAEPFVLIIDEFEQHLHPQWQRELPARLRKVFPGAQLVLTTHSPIVVSELLPRQLRPLQGFALLEGTHREGQDVNEILETLFDTPSRNRETQALIDATDDALDDDDIERAAESLETLEQALGSNDPEVVRLRTLQRIASGQDHDAVAPLAPGP